MQALKRGMAVARRRGELADLPEFPKIRSDPAKTAQKGKLHPLEVLVEWLGNLEAEPQAQEAWLQAWITLHTGLRATEIRRLTSEWIEDATPAVRAESPEVAGFLRLPAASTKNRKERGSSD